MQRTGSVLAALFCLAASTAHAAPRTWQQIQASGTLRLATEGAFPPFNGYEGKKLVGFEVDLGNALGRVLGVKVEWVTQPFDTLLIGLNQGRYDAVLASHAVTPERQKAVDFLRPYYCSAVNIVAKKGGPTTRAALRGKSIGSQVGTAQLPILRRIPGIADVRIYPNDQAVLTALMSGRVDAWSSNGPVVAYILKQARLQDKVVIGEAVSNERNAGAVAKGNKSVHDALNAALAKVMNDGTYSKLSTQWFGQDMG